MNKLLITLLFAAAAAFGQDTPKYAVSGGVDSGIFGTFHYRLSENTSTYSNLHFTGLGATLSQGLSYTLLHANEFQMGVAADAGFTSRAQFAMSVGVMPSFDISKWTKVSGLSVVGRVQMQRIGSTYSPNIGIGLSKSF